jgi:PhoPQ-activated pathogenicity-related protein
MTKAATAAMTATQEFLKSEAGGKRRVDKFVVSGGSKRGWTSWMTAIFDKRVIGVMPIVIDMLNNEAMVKHHYEVLGFFTEALGDYVNHNVMPRLIGTPELRHVMSIEDPFSYRNRPRMRSVPKYILNAAGDQYFLPDNSQFYYKDLPGEKALRYVPNAKHDMAGTDVIDSVIARYQMILDGKKTPRYDWVKEADGTLVVHPRDKPMAANLWQATNPKARDFRVDVIGRAYVSSPLRAQPDGSYVARVPKPAEGYTAFFVELVYDVGGKYPLKVTSEVSVVPDIAPFKWENAAAQYPMKTPR